MFKVFVFISTRPSVLIGIPVKRNYFQVSPMIFSNLYYAFKHKIIDMEFFQMTLENSFGTNHETVKGQDWESLKMYFPREHLG